MAGLLLVLTCALGLATAATLRTHRRDVQVSEALAVDLRRVRDHHRTVLDHLPDLTILCVDRDLVVVSSEGGGADNRHDRLGRHVDDVAPGLRDAFRAALAGSPTSLESESSGRVDAVEVMPVTLPDGQPAALAVSRDVTAQRAAERALQDSEREHRLLTEHATDMITRHGLDGTIRYASPASETILGYAPAELVGWTDRDLVHPDHVQLLLDARARMVAGEDAVAEVRMRRRGGEEIWVEQHLRRVGDELHVTTRDVTRRRAAENAITRLATLDDLTGLWNRRRFHEAVGAEIERAGRRGSAGTLLLVDLDGFKAVNDTFGHNAGDRLLRAVGDALRAELAPGDGAARIGGDEFAVLLPGVDPRDAGAAADRYAAVIAGVRVAAGDGEIAAAGSVGAAPLDGATTAERVLGVADAAMYAAKALGRERPHGVGEPGHALADLVRGDARVGQP